MVFSSTTFLLAFLPLVGILYFICPRKLRNALLLVFSLLFYGWGEPKYILIMLFSTVFDYCNGLAIGHFRAVGKPKGAKAVLVVSVVGNLSILGFFKYTDFAITNLNGLLGTAIPALGLLLPIGISFYTFQTMSYTIDVYRGLVPPQRNIIDFSAYVTLFPQLIAGPIVQYKTVAADLENRNRESLAGASAGMQRFVIGLGEEGAAGQPDGRRVGGDRGHVRALRGHGVAGGAGIYVPDLFRFLRLFRYGHRPGQAVRLPVSGELQLSL